MKKYISIFVAAIALSMGFSSCSTQTDEPAGGTAVEKMAGHWVVTVDALDPETGEILYEDPYGMGEWDMYTYNTAADDADQMWISDGDNFWGYTVKIPINYEKRTFGAENLYIYDDEDDDGNPIEIHADITDGEIIENGGLNPNGKPTDAISYYISFEDDGYGFLYHVHGVRYAGF